MIPVNDSIDRNFLIAQLNYMINSRKTLLAIDCKENNAMGFQYDTGYLQGLLDMFQIVLDPVINESKQDFNKINEDNDEEEPDSI